MIIEKIADKVRFCAINTDKFKTCRINISMAVPLDNNVSANAILAYMLRRRCAKYPEILGLNRHLDEMYGTSVSSGVIKSGETQIISFGMTAVDDRFALDDDKVSLQCAQLLTDLIFYPVTDGESFPEEIIEQEKHLLIETIENEQNDKRQYALRRCESIMFENEAYGINRLGTVDSVKALTAKTVYNAWKNVLKQATFQITMVGSTDAQPVLNMLKDIFSKIERQPAGLSTKFVNEVKEPKYVCETMPLKQGKLVLGFRTDMKNCDDNSVPMKVAVDIFGGGTYSKLFSVVREKMSLCYYCSAGLFNAKGIVMVQSGIEDVNEEKARNEILNQLSLVAKGDFSDGDFNSSIISLADTVLSSGDTPEEICTWYATQITRDKIKTPEEFVNEIKAVTKEQVISCAKTIKLDTVFMLKSNGEVSGDE